MSPADRLATLLSAVFSPYLVTIATTVAVVASLHDVDAWLFGAPMLVCSSLVPLGYTGWLLARGQVTDLHVAVREHRGRIFAVSTLATALCTAWLWWAEAPPVLFAMGCSYVVNGVAFGLANQRSKLSMHTGVLAGCGVLLGRVFGNAVAMACWSAVLGVGWARQRRGKHTAWQAVAGALLGSVLTALVLALLLARPGP